MSHSTRHLLWAFSAIAGALFLLFALSLALTQRADAYVYWANYEGTTIGRASLDGTCVDQGFITGAKAPRGVAVDQGHLYWTDYITNTIGRASLDGTKVDQSFITGADAPSGVAVDDRYVFWTNFMGDKISRANRDGSNVKRDLISTTLPGKIAVDGSHVYWTWGTGPFIGHIGRANLDGSGVNEDFIPYPSSPSLLFSPAGIAVDSSHVYWTNELPTGISRAGIDGRGMQNFIDTRESSNLAVDSSHIYWSTYRGVARANIDGSAVNESFITGAGQAAGIAADAVPSAGIASGQETQKQTGNEIALKTDVCATENLSATGSGKIKVKPNSYDLEQKTIDVADGQTSALELKPKKSSQAKKIAKALKHGDKATAKITVKITGASGPKSTEKLSVKLKR